MMLVSQLSHKDRQVLLVMNNGQHWAILGNDNLPNKYNNYIIRICMLLGRYGEWALLRRVDKKA